MYNVKIVQTNDGSPTLFVPELNEHYHSIYGAFTESYHVFYKNGLLTITTDIVNIFEVGFGTGLNCMLAAYFSYKFNKKVFYQGIDRYPLPLNILNQLNYSCFFNNDSDFMRSMQEEIYTTLWNINRQITDNFLIHKLQNDITEYQPNIDFFDIVFYDAFGPRAQQVMWSNETLLKAYKSLKKGGRLVTYCANGQMKRTLKEIGFLVEAVKGPPGKREMTIAVKK